MPSIEVKGERLDYIVQGTGTPVVLLHGAGADAGLWRETLSALGTKYAAHAINLRGHGGSSCNGPLAASALADDVAGAVATLGLDSFHLVGVSLGGAAAVHLAATAPDRVRSLVLAGVGAGKGQGLADEIYGIREMVHYLVPEDFAPQVAEALLVPDAPAERVAALGESIGVLTKRRYLESLEALAAADLAAVAGKVAAPTLVLHGEMDEIVPAPDADALAAAIRGAKRAEIADAGHLANIDAPEAFAAALTKFWAGLGR